MIDVIDNTKEPYFTSFRYEVGDPFVDKGEMVTEDGTQWVMWECDMCPEEGYVSPELLSMADERGDRGRSKVVCMDCKKRWPQY